MAGSIQKNKTMTPDGKGEDTQSLFITNPPSTEEDMSGHRGLHPKQAGDTVTLAGSVQECAPSLLSLPGTPYCLTCCWGQLGTAGGTFL